MTSLRSQIARCRSARWVLTGLLGVGLAVFYFVGYRPAHSSLTGLQASIAARREEVNANHAQIANLPELGADVQRMTKKLAGPANHLSKESDYAPFMKDITGIIREANLRKLAIQPGLVRDLKLFSEQPISISFEGDFYSIFAFLRQLEQMPRLMRVKNLTITSRDSKTGQVEVRVDVNVYFAEE